MGQGRSWREGTGVYIRGMICMHAYVHNIVSCVYVCMPVHVYVCMPVYMYVYASTPCNLPEHHAKRIHIRRLCTSVGVTIAVTLERP